MDRYVPICENRDFRRLYARGKSYVTPLVVIYVRRMRGQDIRLGITTSKKIGNAVQRNRSRRVIGKPFVPCSRKSGLVPKWFWWPGGARRLPRAQRSKRFCVRN